MVTLQDKVTQPSDSFRPATELASIVGSLHSTDKVSSDKPIFVIVIDGGPDHRPTCLSKMFLPCTLPLFKS